VRTTSTLKYFILKKYQQHIGCVEKLRKREVSFEGGQGPEGDVVPYMEEGSTLIFDCILSGKDYKNV
jgi:hypothetical protein